jgi:GT2 family glycosyltransferase
VSNQANVYVVLLNWNGWQDTIACLQSLFRSRDFRLRVIVCDNASSDGSMERITAWASGTQPIEQPAHPRLAKLVARQAPLPLPTVRIDRAMAEQGTCDSDAPLVLIDNGANLGFAAGNNVGLRFALRQPEMDYVWVLNNDTLVEPDCLANMVRRLQADPAPAVCGSMIHFFDRPEVIQAIGGNRFNRLTGEAACSEGRFTHEDAAVDIGSIEGELDYLSGCSLLLPREFLETVGLMSEDYFLYYEEIDWFTRAAGRYQIRIAPDARIYHREGRSIGSKNLYKPASTLSDFHMFRSRLIYMRKHHGRFPALCYAHSWLAVLKRLLRGQYRNALTVGSVLLGRQSFSG